MNKTRKTQQTQKSQRIDQSAANCPTSPEPVAGPPTLPRNCHRQTQIPESGDVNSIPDFKKKTPLNLIYTTLKPDLPKN